MNQGGPNQLSEEMLSTKNVPPFPTSDILRSKKFILSQMQNSMEFFNPERSLDIINGGYFHFFDDYLKIDKYQRNNIYLLILR